MNGLILQLCMNQPITGSGDHIMKIYRNASLQATVSLGSNPSHVTDNTHPNIHIGAIRTNGSGNTY